MTTLAHVALAVALSATVAGFHDAAGDESEEANAFTHSITSRRVDVVQ